MGCLREGGVVKHGPRVRNRAPRGPAAHNARTTRAPEGTPEGTSLQASRSLAWEAGRAVLTARSPTRDNQALEPSGNETEGVKGEVAIEGESAMGNRTVSLDTPRRRPREGGPVLQLNPPVAGSCTRLRAGQAGEAARRGPGPPGGLWQGRAWPHGGGSERGRPPGRPRWGLTGQQGAVGSALQARATALRCELGTLEPSSRLPSSEVHV